MPYHLRHLRGAYRINRNRQAYLWPYRDLFLPTLDEALEIMHEQPLYHPLFSLPFDPNERP